MGKLTYNLEEFQQAAIKYCKELLKLPLIGIRDTTQHMTVRTGIQGTELVGYESVEAEFAPYKPNRKQDVNLDIVLRPLTTYFGSLNAEFEPNEAISTLLGHRASQAMDGQLSSTVTAREVLALIAKAASRNLNKAIWCAKRNPQGTKTVDLFNGFDTITASAITSGDISAENANLLTLDEAITKDNVVDIFELILDTMDPDLREQDSTIFCSQNLLDTYNRGYKIQNHGIMYNSQFEQAYVEGSNRKMKFVPLASKAGSGFIHIATKQNMLVGVDQESDSERVNVKDYAPDVLTFMMRLFFGVQFRTVHPSQMLVVKLKETAATEP